MTLNMYLAKVEISTIDIVERHRKDFGNMEGLKQSIVAEGLITPIALQKVGNRHRLLAGERRLRAVTELEWTAVDAKVFEGDIDEYTIRCIELAENLYRKDFTWQEKVKLEAQIHSLQIGFHGEKIGPTGSGWSQADTAKFLGTSTGGLSQNLKLASAMETIPQLGECKTKEDATKMLRMLQEQMITEEILRRMAEVSANTEPVNDADLKTALIDSYIVMDALEGFKQAGDESIDFVEIDPPYAIELNKAKRTDQMLDEYHEVDDPEYYDFMGKVFDNTLRVLKPMRWMICWHTYHHSFMLRHMLEQRGFRVSTVPAAWVKPAGQCNHPELNLASTYELFHYAAKGNAILMRQGRSNTFHHNPVPPPRKIHPTEKPIELIQTILTTFCLPGYKILVPFLGSGITLLAGVNEKMDGFGFDLSQAYKKQFDARVLTQEYGKYFNTTEKV